MNFLESFSSILLDGLVSMINVHAKSNNLQIIQVSLSVKDGRYLALVLFAKNR